MSELAIDSMSGTQWLPMLYRRNFRNRRVDMGRNRALEVDHRKQMALPGNHTILPSMPRIRTSHWYQYQWCALIASLFGNLIARKCPIRLQGGFLRSPRGQSRGFVLSILPWTQNDGLESGRVVHGSLAFREMAPAPPSNMRRTSRCKCLQKTA